MFMEGSLCAMHTMGTQSDLTDLDNARGAKAWHVPSMGGPVRSAEAFFKQMLLESPSF